LLLKKLEIYGFKSFAERVHIEFDKGITAVVGPNGSGKSNIADAIRWVLGEQSAKSLRGSKMEDIIFSGTQVRKPLGFAEVSLTMDNSSGSLPIDFSEVTITRRIFRSGDSEYYINKSACRLKDILELFMDTGVGKEGYSIIGQGRIDEILANNSEDRRFIFEEAAGIVKYKTRKEEAERKLAKTHDNLIRVQDILYELEQQIEPLKEQSDKAKKYLDLKERLKVMEINQFIRKYDRYSQKIEDIKKEIAILDDNITMYQKDAKEQQVRKENLDMQLSQVIQDMDEMRDERHMLVEQIEKLNGEIGILNEKMAHLFRDNERLDREFDNVKSEIETRILRRKELTSELANKTDELVKLEDVSNKLKNRIDELDIQIKEYESRIHGTQIDITDIFDKLAKAKNDLTRYAAEKKGLKEHIQKIQPSLKEKEQLFSKLEYEQNDMKKNITDIEEELKLVTSKIYTLGQTMSQTKVRLDDLDKTIHNIERSVQTNVSKLNLLKDMEKDYEGFNRSVKRILESCDKDKLLMDKVCGVVAQLIHVPKEYELAIEVALGGSMQNVVTKTEEDAKYIIDFLRKNKYGRATFLPISSIRPRGLSNEEKNVLKMDGCIGIASELIDYNRKYSNIFSYLLGRVVVVKNMDQGISIAKRFRYSFRIVTIEGDTLNPGGSMTGGSTGNRTTGILGRQREIEELEKIVLQERSQLGKYVNNKKETLVLYNDCVMQLDELRGRERNLEISKTSATEKYVAISNQLLVLEKEINVQKLELKNTINILQDKQLTIMLEQEKIEELESQNSNINNTIEHDKKIIEGIYDERKSIDACFTDTKIKWTKLKEEINAVKQNIKYIDKEVASYRESLLDKEKQKAENKKLSYKHGIEIDKNQEGIKSIQERISILDKAVQDYRQKRQTMQDKIKSLEKKLMDTFHITEQLVNKKHGFEVQMSKMEAEIQNLQNNVWEAYEISYASALPFMDESLSMAQINEKIQSFKENIADLGIVNVNAIEDYKAIKERCDFLSTQKQDLVLAKEDLNKVIDEITHTMEQKFRQEFAIINEYFNEVFISLFGGGQAQLLLDDKNNVLGCGIDIIAQPPGKKLQNISLLSGGEKALTAIAILFAILKHKPTPFCVLDEIDAALDESNIYNFGNFLKQFSENTQFVIITHRRGTMEFCDVMYGIAMEEKGISKMVSVKLNDIE
jgi:chromosome segregation protein